MISPTEICLVKFVPVPVTVLEPAEAAIVPNIFSASSEKADLLFLTKVALDIEEPPPKPTTSSESVATVNDVFDVIEVTTPVFAPCMITSPTLIRGLKMGIQQATTPARFLPLQRPLERCGK